MDTCSDLGRALLVLGFLAALIGLLILLLALAKARHVEERIRHQNEALDRAHAHVTARLSAPGSSDAAPAPPAVPSPPPRLPPAA